MVMRHCWSTLRNADYLVMGSRFLCSHQGLTSFHSVMGCNHSPSSNLSSSEQLETCPTISTYSAPSSCESLCLLGLIVIHTESTRSTQNFSIQQTLHGHTEWEEGLQKKIHSNLFLWPTYCWLWAHRCLEAPLYWKILYLTHFVKKSCPHTTTTFPCIYGDKTVSLREKVQKPSRQTQHHEM